MSAINVNEVINKRSDRRTTSITHAVTKLVCITSGFLNGCLRDNQIGQSGRRNRLVSARIMTPVWVTQLIITNDLHFNGMEFQNRFKWFCQYQFLLQGDDHEHEDIKPGMAYYLGSDINQFNLFFPNPPSWSMF